MFVQVCEITLSVYTENLNIEGIIIHTSQYWRFLKKHGSKVALFQTLTPIVRESPGPV